jgi:hypothetical protein
VPESLQSIKNHIISGKNLLGSKKTKKGKVKFTIEQARKAKRGSRCIALLFL